MEFVNFLLYFLFFVVLLQIIRYWLLVRYVLGLTIKPGNYQIADIDNLPIYLKDIFAEKEKEIIALNFEFSHCQIYDGIFVNPYSQQWELVYFNFFDDIYAILSVSSTPEVNSVCRVGFVSFFADGHKLYTINGLKHDFLGNYANTTLIDPYTASLNEQYNAHFQTLYQLKQEKETLALNPLEYISYEQENIDAYLKELKNTGWIQPIDQENFYRVQLFPAIRFTHNFLINTGKVKTLRDKMLKATKSVKLPVEIPIEVEVESYLRINEQSKPRDMSWIGKLSLFIGSLLLFGISFGLYFSPMLLLVLIVVIFFHELGHLLGMYLFKYKDLKILFIPFFGAAAIGLPDKNIKSYQKAIVYLLGPLPGIIAGVICWAIYLHTNSEIAQLFCFMLLALNYLNLLPIVPFDGGQLFNVIFLPRFPLLQKAFRFISGGLLFILGLLSRDPILLIIGGILLVAAQAENRKVSILAKIRQKIKESRILLTEEAILAETFWELRKKPFHQLPFVQKYQIAKYVVENTAIEVPSFATIISFLIIYVLAFVLPIVVMLFLTVINQHIIR